MKTYLEWEVEDMFIQYIHETWGDTTTLCGVEYDTAYLLRDLDPVRYENEFSNWLDSKNAKTGTNQNNIRTYTF
jgi:hypothetical protein